MKENNGIKIKTNVSYPIMLSLVIGLFAYFEIYIIKRLFVDIKNNNRTDIWEWYCGLL